MCFSLSLKAMWNLMHVMQVIVFTSHIVEWPANTLLLLESMHEAITLEELLGSIEDAIFSDGILGGSNEEKSDSSEMSLFIRYKLFVCMLVLLIVLVLVYLVLYILMRSMRNCTHKLMIIIRNKLFYSAWIRYLIEGNLFITFDAVFFLSEHGGFSSNKKSLSTIFRMAVLIVLVLWIFFAAIFPLVKYQYLHDETFKRKFGSLYEGFDTKRKIAIVYFSVFCFRRLSLVLCLLWLRNQLRILIHVYIVIYSGFFTYLAHAQPNIETSMNWLETFNEVAVVLLHYIMLFFVYGTAVEPATQWEAGNAAVTLIAVVFCANIVYLVLTVGRKIFKRRFLRQIRATKLREAKLRKLRMLTLLN